MKYIFLFLVIFSHQNSSADEYSKFHLAITLTEKSAFAPDKPIGNTLSADLAITNVGIDAYCGMRLDDGTVITCAAVLSKNGFGDFVRDMVLKPSQMKALLSHFGLGDPTLNTLDYSERRSDGASSWSSDENTLLYLVYNSPLAGTNMDVISGGHKTTIRNVDGSQGFEINIKVLNP